MKSITAIAGWHLFFYRFNSIINFIHNLFTLFFSCVDFVSSLFLFVWLTVWVFILGGSGLGGSADGACPADDIECAEHDRLGMEAIRSLHQQLDDDENGNIDLSESDDVSIFLSANERSFFPSSSISSFYSFHSKKCLQLILTLEST